MADPYITFRGPGGWNWDDGPGGVPMKASRHDPNNWSVSVNGAPPIIINEIEMCFWDDTQNQVDCKITWENNGFHVRRADGADVGFRPELHYFNITQGTEWWVSHWDTAQQGFVSRRAA